VHEWFPEGSNPVPAALHAAALPDELENHSSGCSDSNAISPGPRPGGAPHPLHPVSGPPRIRTENFLVAGQALYQLELAAHAGALAELRAPDVPQALSGRTYFRPGWPASFMVFRCGVVNAQAHSPEGGASQGWRESNTHSAGFGDRIPNRWVIPTHMKSRPTGFPVGGSWPELVGSYPEAPCIPRIPLGCGNAGMQACLSSR
jgi:hypothetical protein